MERYCAAYVVYRTEVIGLGHVEYFFGITLSAKKNKKSMQISMFVIITFLGVSTV